MSILPIVFGPFMRLATVPGLGLPLRLEEADFFEEGFLLLDEQPASAAIARIIQLRRCMAGAAQKSGRGNNLS
ncbi:MAG: hypothetical protein WCP23_03085 [Planctomycetota bacterium]|nr:hypothetical protein [Planctomycetia bacterium]